MQTAHNVRLTVLVENNADPASLGSEHGWSVLVETDDSRGLFDTGQSGLVVDNASALDVDLRELEWIVLSHGHYDHTGGLEAVLTEAAPVTVYCHPEAFPMKFVREGDGRYREAGMELSRQVISKKGADLKVIPGAAKIGKGLTTTGEIPRVTNFEPIPERFFLARDGERVPDQFRDDQAMVFSCEQGLVVLVGCAHAGVVNTIKYAIELTGIDRVYAVIGGMHLARASEKRLAQTVRAFQELEIEMVGPAHCTGQKATAQFKREFGDGCLSCPAGTRLEF